MHHSSQYSWRRSILAMAHPAAVLAALIGTLGLIALFVATAIGDPLIGLLAALVAFSVAAPVLGPLLGAQECPVMTGMLAAQRDGVIARRMATLPATLSTEDQAALIGRQDAARPGARLRLFLSARPRLRSAARIIFGLGSQNGLADARLEAIRQGALLAALGR